MNSSLGPHRIPLSEIPALLKAGGNILFRQPFAFTAAALLAGLGIRFAVLASVDPGIDFQLVRWPAYLAFVAIGSAGVSLAAVFCGRDDGNSYSIRDLVRAVVASTTFLMMIAVVGSVIGFLVGPLFAPAVTAAPGPSAKLPVGIVKLFLAVFDASAVFLMLAAAYAASTLGLGPLRASRIAYAAAILNFHFFVMLMLLGMMIQFFTGLTILFSFDSSTGSGAMAIGIVAGVHVLAAPLLYAIVRRIFGGPAENGFKANEAEIFFRGSPAPAARPNS